MAVRTRSFYRSKLFDEPPSHYRQVSRLLVESSAAGLKDVCVCLSLGKLIGTESRNPVRLPIQSDCILDNSPEVEFVEQISRPDGLSRITSRLLPSAADNFHVVYGGEITTREFLLEDGCTVVIERSSSVLSREIVKISRRADVHICRPRSDLHFRVSCISRRECAAPVVSEPDGVPGDRISEATRRRVASWDLFPKVPGPAWCLIVHEIEELVPPSRLLDLEQWREQLEDDDAKPVTVVRLFVRLRDWTEQARRALEGLSHGVLRIIQELLVHGEALGRLLDEPLEFRPLFYPSYFGDQAALSRQHYNSKQRKGLCIASRSPIEGLRRMNNEVKRCLIEAWVPQRAKVLDLACGHGQDMLKYADKLLAKYVGIDISPEEIKEAHKRLEQSPPPARAIFEFHVGNLLLDATYASFAPETFDVVSCQLAIHYCMATERQADGLCSQIASKLKPGGAFIGSTGSSDVIARRVVEELMLAPKQPEGPRDQPRVFWFGNSVYRVMFLGDQLAKLNGGCMAPVGVEQQNQEEPVRYSVMDASAVARSAANEWGIEYNFYLMDHIDLREFVVPWEAFCRVAERHGLQLRAHDTFDCFYEAQLKTNARLADWHRSNQSKLRFDHQQREAFGFYGVFVFVKEQQLPPQDITTTTTTAATAATAGKQVRYASRDNTPVPHVKEGPHPLSLASGVEPPPPPSAQQTEKPSSSDGEDSDDASSSSDTSESSSSSESSSTSSSESTVDAHPP